MVLSAVGAATTVVDSGRSGGIISSLIRLTTVAIGFGTIALIIWIGLLLFPNTLQPGGGFIENGGLLGWLWRFIGIPQAADPVSTFAANNWTFISAGLAAFFPSARALLVVNR